MATKEVMMSAPLIVLLYDRTFVARSFRAAWQRHGRLFAALAATWLLLAVAPSVGRARLPPSRPFPPPFVGRGPSRSTARIGWGQPTLQRQGRTARAEVEEGERAEVEEGERAEVEEGERAEVEEGERAEVEEGERAECGETCGR